MKAAPGNVRELPSFFCLNCVLHRDKTNNAQHHNSITPTFWSDCRLWNCVVHRDEDQVLPLPNDYFNMPETGDIEQTAVGQF